MPVHTTPDGCALHYRIAGEGPLVALTPGGREGMSALAPLIAELSRGCRVLSWDRRNTGRSDVFFGGEGSEQEIWADDLAGLLKALDLGPAWIAGGSAGCRVAVLTAIRHPEVARGLVLWSASGGPFGCQYLGFNYHVPYILAAERGGMEAVARTPFFADRIAASPGNRDRLMAEDPRAFVATMKRWNRFFYFQPDTPLVGASEDQLRAIRMPALIFEGNDDIHPAEVSAAMARLMPGAVLRPSAWSREAFMDIFVGRKPGPLFDLYPALAPGILQFVGAA